MACGDLEGVLRVASGDKHGEETGGMCRPGVFIKALQETKKRRVKAWILSQKVRDLKKSRYMVALRI